MSIIDKLSNKINQLEKDSQKRKMYEDIYTTLLISCNIVAKETNNRISDIIANIEYDVEFFKWEEHRGIVFYTTLDNSERRYLSRFDLYF